MSYKLSNDRLRLIEQPEIEKPDEKLLVYVYQEYYDAAMEDYKKHIASLKEIPIQGVAPDHWKENEIVPEGEYRLGRGKQNDTTDQQQWQEMTGKEKDKYFEVVAIPINVPVAAPQNEEAKFEISERDQCENNDHEFRAFIYEHNGKSQRIIACAICGVHGYQEEAEEAPVLNVQEQQMKNLLRELTMRSQIVFPENEQDLIWFEEGIIGQTELFNKIMKILELGKMGRGLK